jgi:DNA-binding transcriptional ArsR family regulator
LLAEARFFCASSPQAVANICFDNYFCLSKNCLVLDLDVIDEPVAARVALDPIRNRLLRELAQPASAAALAERLGIARQKVNYHLRTLEAAKLVETAEERLWGGITERLMVATAAAYVVSPGALGAIAAKPENMADRLSAAYLIALAARAVREVGGLWRRARLSERRLATLSLDTVICFKSPADRAAFTAELTQVITSLAARYHSEQAPNRRAHRLLVAAYPAPETSQ